MRNQTVAQQMVDVLRQAGVERIYGVVGDSLNSVVDAVRRTDGIEWVHVRNEEAAAFAAAAAAFAAAAEAQLTGRLAVCAGSCGPGNTHLIQGLYDAHRSGAPVLAIASHIPSHQIGTGFFQETHPERLFTDCSDYCEMISTPAQMPRVLRIALQRALGNSGVSVLVIPGDAAHDKAVNPTGAGHLVTERGRVVAPAAQVRELADKLNAARKVMLFCGAGVRDAHAEVMALAERAAAPVGHSLRGKEWIQFDNAYDIGMSGLLGYGACFDAMHEADLVVLLGTDFPYNDFLPQARSVQIDHDAGRLGRRTVLELGVHGDVRETLRAVLPLVEAKEDRAFLHRMLRKHARSLEAVVSPLHPRRRAAHAHPPRVRGFGAGRARRRRRGVHRGHRHVQRVGSALSDPQRPAPGDRFVRARHDGQRSAARHRRTVRRPRAPGDLDVG